LRDESLPGSGGRNTAAISSVLAGQGPWLDLIRKGRALGAAFKGQRHDRPNLGRPSRMRVTKMACAVFLYVRICSQAS